MDSENKNKIKKDKKRCSTCSRLLSEHSDDELITCAKRDIDCAKRDLS